MNNEESILKYSSPTLIDEVEDKRLSDDPTRLHENEAQSELQGILNAIQPPKRFTKKNGATYKQQVSTAVANRADVIRLMHLFDSSLQRLDARSTGICPQRRILYSELFDELIRQVAVDCKERGLLLLRIRDEIYYTLTAYQALFKSSVTLGLNKALIAEECFSERLNEIADLKEEKRDLERQIIVLNLKLQQIENRSYEVRQAQEKKFVEEMEVLEKLNNQMKDQLDKITEQKEKVRRDSS